MTGSTFGRDLQIGAANREKSCFRMIRAHDPGEEMASSRRIWGRLRFASAEPFADIRQMLLRPGLGHASLQERLIAAMDSSTSPEWLIFGCVPSCAL